MPVCPKCSKVITCLDRLRTGVESAVVRYDEQFEEMEGVDESFDADDRVLEFSCPECQRVIFKDYDEAEKFFKDKDELAELVAETIREKE